uniref:Uncharacterized protein n=1 Tax=Opuntia streptacantha TaxID=393608 RepID=A0A7C9D0C4_OPUST
MILIRNPFWRQLPQYEEHQSCRNNLSHHVIDKISNRVIHNVNVNSTIKGRNRSHNASDQKTSAAYHSYKANFIELLLSTSRFDRKPPQHKEQPSAIYQEPQSCPQ